MQYTNQPDHTSPAATYVNQKIPSNRIRITEEQDNTDSTKTKSRSRERQQKKHRQLKRIKRTVTLLFTLALILTVTALVFALNTAITQQFFGTPRNSNIDMISKNTSNDGSNTQSPNSAKINTDDWRLLLVNSWNSIPDEHSVTLTHLNNGHAIDERCYPDLQQMMDDCHSAGLQPLICSSYRTQEVQEQLFNNKLENLLAQGYSLKNAQTEAEKAVAIPGTSEHQLGLSVDIVDINNQNLDSSQESTAVQEWLMKNSWKYGFVLRYPSGKSDITGIIHEPWHYRYVGKEAAKEIYEQDICLEEYLEKNNT